MMQILGTRGVFAFVELEKEVHPMIPGDSVAGNRGADSVQCLARRYAP